jgi:hypothetical protein
MGGLQHTEDADETPDHAPPALAASNPYCLPTVNLQKHLLLQ